MLDSYAAVAARRISSGDPKMHGENGMKSSKQNKSREQPYSLVPESTASSKSEVSDKIVIVGDSIVRNLNIYGESRKVHTECLPGARVLDVAYVAEYLLNNKFKNVEQVIIHAGTNDVKHKESETLKKHFIVLIENLTTLNKKVIISGPLPVYNRGCETFSRLLSLNTWLRAYCNVHFIPFVDNWDLFWERPGFFNNDGLHPNKRGATVLSNNIQSALNLESSKSF